MYASVYQTFCLNKAQRRSFILVFSWESLDLQLLFSCYWYCPSVLWKCWARGDKLLTKIIYGYPSYNSQKNWEMFLKEITNKLWWRLETKSSKKVLFTCNMLFKIVCNQSEVRNKGMNFIAILSKLYCGLATGSFEDSEKIKWLKISVLNAPA